MSGLAIRLHEQDNVATATTILSVGDVVQVMSEQGERLADVPVRRDMPQPFHKLALFDIKQGQPVRKYGEVIGHATAPIAQGEWVHVHNVQSANLPEPSGVRGDR